MRITAQPLTAEAFRPFGDVIQTGGSYLSINQGKCRRYHDLAQPDVVDGVTGINLFHAEIREVPYSFDLLERHPQGSQAFLPMDGSEYLVIVAPDDSGRPGAPLAFRARADQGVNLGRNVWHGVLAPISGGGLFAVVDRIGDGPNLEEYTLPSAVTVAV